MVPSQKSQYAVRAVFELAKRQGFGPVKAAQIAEAQFIPVRFLENILGQLRLAGIVESARGKEGGYSLSRAPQDITVGEVLTIIQGPVSEIDCAGATGEAACRLQTGCVLLPMWEKAHQAMMDVYNGTSFRDLVDQEMEAHDRRPLDYAI
jgi:Rrf2 family cysteine metabolism transcriptional repressor